MNALSAATGNDGYWNQFVRWCFRPVDAVSLVIFRLGFGGIMLWEVFRYFDHGWVTKYYTGKEYYFHYPGFSWVKPWGSEWAMELHFYLMGFLAILIMLGLCYRLATTVFFFMFTYIFLLEQARYLNHFYFVCLVAFLMILIPANRRFALDAYIWPTISRWWTPNWAPWILKLQIGVVYFYGGISKITPDWLKGYPMRDWITDAEDVIFIGPYVHEPWLGLFLSHAGLLIDLLIVPALLWRRTRFVAYLFVLAFNYMNDQMFSIGIFPWFMIAGSTLFFEPDWPQRMWDFCTLRRQDQLAQEQRRSKRLMSIPTIRLGRPQQWLAAFLVGWMAFQCLWPFRHHLYPGIVHWTEEGHMFAWHMKLRSKRGRVDFVVKTPSDETFVVDPDDHLNSRQLRKMAARPEMILQFAHYLCDIYADDGEVIEVYAESFASLNGRRSQRMIDPSFDLCQVQWSWLPADWIIPLHEPLLR